MKITTTLIIIAIFTKAIIAQEKAIVSENDSIYSFVDQPPEFLGGISEIGNYLSLSLSYPAQALKDSIEGKVYVGFVVEIDGSVSEVKLLRGIGGGCDEEAVRVVGEMPKWNPGKLKGAPVRVSKTLPINFSLATPAQSQTKIYREADTLPEFVGGQVGLNKYLVDNITGHKKVSDTINELEVKVYFVVETDGSLSSIMVVDSIGYGLDKKAIDIVKNMPKWKPGKIGNTKVRVLLYLLIDFAVYGVVDTMPEFSGGINNLMYYLATNINYPVYAYNNGIQGRVFINFFVEGDGTVSNVTVKRGVGGGCDEEAMRVVKNMPKWKAGIHRGKPVRVSYNLPVNFTL